MSRQLDNKAHGVARTRALEGQSQRFDRVVREQCTVRISAASTKKAVLVKRRDQLSGGAPPCHTVDVRPLSGRRHQQSRVSRVQIGLVAGGALISLAYVFSIAAPAGAITINQLVTTLSPAGPVVTGTAVTDAASLVGTNVDSINGTISYAVYSDSACTNLVAALGSNLTVTNGVIPASTIWTATPTGQYWFQATFSDPAFHITAVTSACASEPLTVVSPSVPAGGTGSSTATSTPATTPSTSTSTTTAGPASSSAVPGTTATLPGVIAAGAATTTTVAQSATTTTLGKTSATTVPSTVTNSTTAPSVTTTTTATAGTPAPTPAVAAVPGATSVHTGEPWAGSHPYLVLLFATGLGLLATGLIRRRRSAAGDGNSVSN